jgi:hypothetical protein
MLHWQMMAIYPASVKSRCRGPGLRLPVPVPVLAEARRATKPGFGVPVRTRRLQVGVAVAIIMGFLATTCFSSSLASGNANGQRHGAPDSEKGQPEVAATGDHGQPECPSDRNGCAARACTASLSGIGTAGRSYLTFPRIIFSGRFQSDVSTVNNDPAHFDSARFQPNYDVMKSSLDHNGAWNPRGTGAWRFSECVVTQVIPWYRDHDDTAA